MMELNWLERLNKLFCSFTTKDELENTIKTINNNYSVLYKKIFVLESPQSTELICTYNIDTGNINNILPNTILMHRKKDSNTLYTINALNTLIVKLNGKLDKSFPVPWGQYSNCILLTQNNDDIRRLDTSIFKVFNLN